VATDILRAARIIEVRNTQCLALLQLLAFVFVSVTLTSLSLGKFDQKNMNPTYYPNLLDSLCLCLCRRVQRRTISVLILDGWHHSFPANFTFLHCSGPIDGYQRVTGDGS
jgi:hypothetical protein